LKRQVSIKYGAAIQGDELFNKADARRNFLRAEKGPCNKYIKDGKCRLVRCSFSHTNSNTFKTVPCPNPKRITKDTTAHIFTRVKRKVRLHNFVQLGNAV